MSPIPAGYRIIPWSDNH